MTRASPCRKVVGITGSTGAGKSLLATRICASPRGLQLAAARGVPWAVNLEVDVIGHELLGEPEMRSSLCVEFGHDILSLDGNVDRKRLGRIVFADAEARARLNRLMHPAMVARVGARLTHEREVGTMLVIVNAALLLTMNLDRCCDLVIQVRAGEDVRLDRLVTYRRMRADDARPRLRAQDPEPPASDRLLTCDNNGTIADLDRWVDDVLLPLVDVGDVGDRR